MAVVRTKAIYRIVCSTCLLIVFAPLPFFCIALSRTIERISGTMPTEKTLRTVSGQASGRIQTLYCTRILPLPATPKRNPGIALIRNRRIRDSIRQYICIIRQEYETPDVKLNWTAQPQISIVHRPFYPGGQWFAETTQSIRKHLKNPEFRTCGETGAARKRKIPSAAPCTAQKPTQEPGSLRDIPSNEKAIARKTAARDTFAF